MTSDAITILKMLFNAAYSFLTAFEIPGTHMTPLAMILFVAFAVAVISFFKSFNEGNHQ